VMLNKKAPITSLYYYKLKHIFTIVLLARGYNVFIVLDGAVTIDLVYAFAIIGRINPEIILFYSMVGL
jgi:hypothetical protein